MTMGAILKTVSLAGIAILICGCTGTAAPKESFDGLVLQPDTKFGEVYRRPGVDLSEYRAYGLEPCEVAFKKNWMRDQNSSRLDLGNRVTQKDVDRIKDALGAECGKYFRAALEKAPPYKLVDSFDNGEQVLVLHPSIIDLDITAPDTRTTGMQRTYTTQTGEMTLVLELLDGTTGEILVRIVDRQRSRETSWLQWTNAVTNQAEARRVLGRWAGQFRQALDTATADAGKAQ